MLNSHRVVTREQFLDALEVSPATFKRDLEYLRDRLAAPIVWDREKRGYCYDRSDPLADQYQLPGLWFNSSEIQALLTMHVLLENIQPGILLNKITPLQSRIQQLLDESDHSADDIRQRIRILMVAAKRYRNDYFEIISRAVLSRHKIIIRHYNRQTDTKTEREVSPQRLTFYRNNWYLDSWCHWRKAIRSFAVDAITNIQIKSDAAIDVDPEQLDKELSSGYGIFSGAETQLARLKFSPQLARWVSLELWHPKQSSFFDDSGFYHLDLPYSQDKELIMDILKYGDGVEVIGPDSLKQKVAQRIADMNRIYHQS